MLSNIPRLVLAGISSGVGKTTAALGLSLRAVGYGLKICMIQFIKGSWHYGELDSIGRLAPEFELVTAGKGFVGILDDKSPHAEHVKACQDAIKIANMKIQSGKYDIVILDEINYAIDMKLASVDDVLNIISTKPPELDLVLTGNHANSKIIEIADLVTEMKEIKHPFKSGIKAKKGIDF